MMLNVDDGCSVLLSFFFEKASLYISLKISLNGMKIVVCIFFLYEQNTKNKKKNNFIIVHTNVKLFNSIIIYNISNCLKLIPRWNYSSTHTPRLKKHTNHLKLIRWKNCSTEVSQFSIFKCCRIVTMVNKMIIRKIMQIFFKYNFNLLQDSLQQIEHLSHTF